MRAEADSEPCVGYPHSLVRALNDCHLTARLSLYPGTTAHARRALPFQPACCRLQPSSNVPEPCRGRDFRAPFPSTQVVGFGTILRSIFGSDLRKHQHGKIH